MSTATVTASDTPDGVPFYRTLPLWVLDVANRSGVLNYAITAAKVMPKTAELVTVNGDTVKVRRRDAFPGRS